MNNWKNAVLAQDIDTIMEHYSEIYSAHEAKSKEEMREFWEEVIEAGMLENIVINLQTSRLEIIDHTAATKSTQVC